MIAFMSFAFERNSSLLLERVMNRGFTKVIICPARLYFLKNFHMFEIAAIAEPCVVLLHVRFGKKEYCL